MSQPWLFRIPALQILCLLLAILSSSSAWAVIQYVNAAATGANNGASWTDAYTDLQLALAAAQAGDEIWVATGTYKPTGGTDRTISFVMTTGVGIYGCFAGNETDRAQRNLTVITTMLSGDIGVAGEILDNSYHVVVGASNAVLDGFSITNGNANSSSQPDDRGGGMINDSFSPIIVNCKFNGNQAGNDSGEGGGGGMYNNVGSVTLSNCTFSDNLVKDFGAVGGAIISGGGYLTVVDCSFIHNRSTAGGGIYNMGSSSLIMINSTFSDNSSSDHGFGFGGGDGGGIYNAGNSASTVTNCMFNENTADGDSSGGGGIFNAGNSAITVTNCTFSRNQANEGGGIHGSLTVTNCTFSHNLATYGSGWGGGMLSSGGTVTNCTFSGNSCDGSGGAGGGMFINNVSSSSTVVNCTFSGNSANQGGGMFNFDGSPTVTNCILSGNSADFDDQGPEILNHGGNPTFRNCDIRGSGGSGATWDSGLGIEGGGNIDFDPRFVNASDPNGLDGISRTVDDGLRLLSGSLCIDAGHIAGAPTTDILDKARVGAPDIGAYEGAVLKSDAKEWALYQ